MSPRGIEPRSTGPKPGILSIKLRAHTCYTKIERDHYLNLYSSLEISSLALTVINPALAS